ncbi:hypothetical protein [Saccharospirillum sp.]|uniref:hypothetical protein n=1 Tax=Saccharospirillum sp. TaxID=2033801 RepID=UPI0034A00FBB
MVIVRHSLGVLFTLFSASGFAFDQYLLKSIEQFDEFSHVAVERGSIFSCPSRTEECLIQQLNENVPLDNVDLFLKVSPGLIKPRFSTEIDGVRLDPDDELILLDYLMEGRSRILFEGKYYRWKVPRSFEKCAEPDNDLRYCWAELIRPASIERWMYVEQNHYGAYWVPWEYIEVLD